MRTDGQKGSLKMRRQRINAGMKILLALGLMALCVGHCAVAGALDNKNPTLSIRATDLYEAFEKNTIAAAQQYKDRRASIGGQVKEIAQDSDGSPYLLIRGREYSPYGVKCRFTPEFEQRLAALKPGNNVAVHGTIEGRRGTLGNVVVVDCRFP